MKCWWSHATRNPRTACRGVKHSWLISDCRWVNHVVISEVRVLNRGVCALFSWYCDCCCDRCAGTDGSATTAKTALVEGYVFQTPLIAPLMFPPFLQSAPPCSGPSANSFSFQYMHRHVGWSVPLTLLFPSVSWSVGCQTWDVTHELQVVVRNTRDQFLIVDV